MDASNIINLGILAVAAIAAVIAILQVVEARKVRQEANEARDEARRARDDAAKHEAEALKAAQRSADSAETSADSQRRIAIVQEARLALERPEPWLLTQVARQRWKITNNTGQNVDFFVVGAEPDVIHREDFWSRIPRNVNKGESLYFSYGGSFGNPASVNIKISWRDAEKKGRDAFFTIP